MNDKMAIFIFSVNVINRLLLSFLVLTKVITLSGIHCITKEFKRAYENFLKSKFLLQKHVKVILNHIYFS